MTMSGGPQNRLLISSAIALVIAQSAVDCDVMKAMKNAAAEGSALTIDAQAG
jgi:hypothetical protein